MRWMAALAALLVILAPAAGLAADAAASSQSIFDAPAAVKKLKLPRTRADPSDRNELACFTYNEMRVRQLDLGEVGATVLAILPLKPGAKAPACQKTKAPGEIVIDGKGWGGYFKGVKGRYVPFDADDGTNGGLGFAVFDGHDGRKLFDDLAVGDLHSAEAGADGLRLRYRRAVAGPCSMIGGGADCWTKIAEAVPDLKDQPAPDCAAGYRKAKAQMARGRCDAQSDKSDGCFDKEMKGLDDQHWDDAPSVIAYDVESLVGGAMPVIKRTGGELSCWPSD